MARDSIVQRLITFLKKNDSLNTPVHNPYDDFEPQVKHEEPAEHVEQLPPEPAPLGLEALDDVRITGGTGRLPTEASRLDALVMRAVQQFKAQLGFVVRYEHDGAMRYCTGRDIQGRYVPHNSVDPDRRALFLALDSGEAQLFVHTMDDNTPVAVLCGPLWSGDKVVGLLYLDNPARSSLHRGIFDVFCDQAARMLGDGVG